MEQVDQAKISAWRETLRRWSSATPGQSFRWLLVLPSALIAAAVVKFFSGPMLWQLFPDSLHDSPLLAYGLDIVRSFLCPIAAVTAGGKVAPNSKIPTAIVLAVLYSNFATFALNEDARTYFGFTCLCITAAGALAGVWKVYEENPTQQSPSLLYYQQGNTNARSV